MTDQSTLQNRLDEAKNDAEWRILHAADDVRCMVIGLGLETQAFNRVAGLVPRLMPITEIGRKNRWRVSVGDTRLEFVADDDRAWVHGVNTPVDADRMLAEVRLLRAEVEVAVRAITAEIEARIAAWEASAR